MSSRTSLIFLASGPLLHRIPHDRTEKAPPTWRQHHGTPQRSLFLTSAKEKGGVFRFQWEGSRRFSYPWDLEGSYELLIAWMGPD